MDIHRCRFVPYPPSAINALAFSHPSSLESKHRGPLTLRLAIGRANGDIEIWNPQQGAWFQESVLKGGKDRSIEGLVWIQDPEELDKNGSKLSGKLRLFSIGYSTSVTEWDLATGMPARHCAGNYGEIWCITAQPRQTNGPQASTAESGVEQPDWVSQSQDIAVGCADGAVVIFSTANEDLQYSRSLTTSSSKKARVLSIAYQSPHVVVTGHADSTIRVFDVRSRQLLRSMSLGAGPAGGPKEILVWAVRCACDGTIVSGDSTGTVRFWDGQTYGMIQRIKGHVADILDIAVSADGKSAISGGMDRRTTFYRRKEVGKKGEKCRWKEITHQRLHKHDVKALAAYETKSMSILVSGGLDTKPIITPIQQFGKEYHRTLSPLPQQPQVLSVPGKRLMVSWWDREISIWKISKSHDLFGTFEDDMNSEKQRKIKLLSKIELQNEESLTSVDISLDGRLIVAATSLHIKMFRLRFHDKSTLKLGKFDLPSKISRFGAKIVKFSPDKRWLLTVRPDSTVELHRTIEVEEPRRATKVLEKGVILKRLKRAQIAPESLHGDLGKYKQSISRIDFSADSRILAVADLNGYVDTWVLEGHEDLTQQDMLTNGAATSYSSDSEESDSDEEQHPLVIFGQHWIRNPVASLIPKLDSTPVLFSFRPSQTSSEASGNVQVAVHATRQTPYPHSHALPQGEDRLFVLTSEHHMYEFVVLGGRFTDWSRKNPTTNLPAKFRILDDRAMGLVWDITKPKERIWLYGNSWLWMFDLSQDFSNNSIDENQPLQQQDLKPKAGSKKRKRNTEEISHQTTAHRSQKSNTGAGDPIPDSKLSSGLGHMVRKIEGSDTARSRWLDLGQARVPTSEDDEQGEIKTAALVELQREEDEETAGEEAAGLNGKHDSHGERATSHPRCWSTFKYRPILGIVPLGDEVLLNDNQDLEVALIERPLEEVELPARFYGDQEWDEAK